MRNYLIFPLALLAAMILFVGCGNRVEQVNSSTEDDLAQRNDGVLYGDVSDRFDITVYPTKIIEEDGNKNIVYCMSVINKSEESYKDFFATIAMNPALDQYIAAGVYPLPLTKIDLAAKSAQELSEQEGKGVDLIFQQLISDEIFIKEAGLEYADIFELGKNFELWLEWDGGKEQYPLMIDVVDEC